MKIGARSTRLGSVGLGLTLAVAGLSGAVPAQNVIKLGMVSTFSGPSPNTGRCSMARAAGVAGLFRKFGEDRAINGASHPKIA